MSKKNITYLPVVEKDGKLYSFGEANKLINENKLLIGDKKYNYVVYQISDEIV